MFHNPVCKIQHSSTIFQTHNRMVVEWMNLEIARFGIVFEISGQFPIACPLGALKIACIIVLICSSMFYLQIISLQSLNPFASCPYEFFEAVIGECEYHNG